MEGNRAGGKRRLVTEVVMARTKGGAVARRHRYNRHRFDGIIGIGIYTRRGAISVLDYSG